jgi:hypothetical protein
MVFLIDQGIDTIVGQVFPVEGAWSSLLGILVAVRVLLYALTSEPGSKGESSLGRKDILIYFLTLFYFGTLGVVLVLLTQVLRRAGISKFLSEKLPAQEHNPNDVVLVICAALISWVVSTPYLVFVKAYFPIQVLQGTRIGWIVILVAMLYYIQPAKEEESEQEGKRGLRASMQSSIVLYAVIILVLGFDWLYLLFIFMIAKPWIGKIWRLFRKGKEAVAASAETKAEKEAEKAAEKGAEEGAETAEGKLLSAFKGIIKEYSEKEAGELTKEVETIHAQEESQIASVAGNIAKLSAKEKANLDMQDKEAGAVVKKLKKVMPSKVLFWIAFLFAAASDILDWVGVGLIPGVSLALDIVTAIPYALYLFTLKDLIKKEKLNNIKGLLSGLGPILELVGDGPWVFLDLNPGWLEGIWALSAYTKKSDTVASYKAALKKDKELKKEMGQDVSWNASMTSWFKSNGIKVVVAVAILFLVVSIGLPMMGFNLGSQVLAAERHITSGRFILDIQQSMYNAFGKATGIFIAPKLWWEQQLEILRGDVFVSEVDSSATRKLGLFWEDLRPAEKEFRSGQRAIVWATIKGEALNSSKCFENESSSECSVRISCLVKDSLDVEAVPKQMSMLDLMGSGDSVSCKFVPKASGIYEVSFVSEVSFQTKSYLPVYFADRSLAHQYSSQGKDILDVAGIKEKNPIATYSPGPIAIGIESFSGQPFLVDTGASNSPDLKGTTIGISLQNTWRTSGGQLKKLNDLVIVIPNKFRLDECTPAEFKLDHSDTTSSYYKISANYIKADIEETDTKSFRCVMTPIPQADGQSVLYPGAEVTIHSIKVIADYKYAVIAKTTTRVLAGESEEKPVDKSSEAMMSYYDQCPSSVSSCEYSSENYCDADPCKNNCYWDYTLQNECLGCSEFSKCSQLDSKEKCDLDPCDKSCDWDAVESECITKELIQTIKLPSDTNIVTSCGSDYVKMLTARYAYAIESGSISSSADNSITIQHPEGYQSQYSDLAERLRKGGNVAKREIIGRTNGNVTFKLYAQGKWLSGNEIVAFLETKRGYTLELKSDSGCAAP